MPQKKKAKKAPKATSAKSETTVTRIVATDTDAAPKQPEPKTEKPAKTKVTKTKDATPAAIVAPAAAEKTKTKRARKSPKGFLGALAKPFVALGRYFKGAWVELRQVRWPTRKATWGLTFAVMVYTAFFAVLVLLLDALFKYLFELMLGK